jgi:glycosyltransferase involved in cell wall biosynthesis
LKDLPEAKRLLVVAVSDFKPRVGGIAEMTHELVENWVSAGREATVIAKRQEGDAEFDAVAGYPVLRIDPANCRESIAKAIAETRPDIVLVNVLGGGWGDAYREARAAGLPIAIFVYGQEITINHMKPKTWFKTIVALKLSDGVFACSSFTRDYVIEHYHLDPAKCFVVAAGISPDYPRNTEEDSSILSGFDLSGKKMVLTLCRLVERKGIDRALIAMERLAARHDDLVYIIAGGGVLQEKLKAMIAERGLSRFAFMTGPVTEAQKHFLYKRQEVFLMPNRMLPNGDVEGFGITFLEANMYGKPAIGGRSGGAVEAIEDGKSGALVDPDDIDDIASAVEKILYTPGLAARMGGYGKARALESYNYEKSVRDFMKYLDFTAIRRKSGHSKTMERE